MCIYIRRQFLQLTINSAPYGIAKQLNRDRYSSAVHHSRLSSLKNLSQGQSYLTHYLHGKYEQPNSASATKQPSKTSLPASQTRLYEGRTRDPPHQYYSSSRRDELIQLKYEQLSRQVHKNSEDLKRLKQGQCSKLRPNQMAELSQELNKLHTRESSFYLECLRRIREVRDRVAESESRLVKVEIGSAEKLGVRTDEKMVLRVKSMIEERVRQETNKIKLIIENQISKISHELRWELEKEKSEGAPLKSKMKYPFSSTQIVHSEYLQASCSPRDSSTRLSTRESSDCPRSGKVLRKNETIYCIDREGFLLDQENCYLLDSEEKMIRLDSKMIEELRREGMLG